MQIPWNQVVPVAAVIAAMPFIVWYAEREEKAKIGTPCDKEMIGSCWGPDQRIYCIDGKWVAEPCRGPRGCDIGPKGKDGMSPVTCDTSKNHPGDPCLHEGPTGCGDDGKSLLVCESRKMTVTMCARGCRLDPRDGPRCNPAP